MEVVDPKNVKPKVFMGPYSILLPHRCEYFYDFIIQKKLRDGRMEHPGDRVLCNQAIQDSLHTGAPVSLASSSAPHIFLVKIARKF